MSNLQKLKPRVFIGSSVEGLSVAYAVQQNLDNDAEITVWNQGVFELSATTIESLNGVISDSDFGIFVFSPDDQVRMRGSDSLTVRDNVLFEMGLFIGKLGRERVFFLLPEKTDMRIPSDLLGITPAKYKPNRSDNKLQAATAPASHNMRLIIQKLGPIQTDSSVIEMGGDAPKIESEQEEDGSWIFDFFQKRYDQAKTKLALKLQSEPTDESEDKFFKPQAWIYYCDFKLGDDPGMTQLHRWATENAKSIDAQRSYVGILNLEGHVQKAVDTIKKLDASIQDDPDICLALANYHVKLDETELAMEVLRRSELAPVPAVSIRLSELLVSNEEMQQAIEVLHAAYTLDPKHQELRYKYARLAEDQKLHSISLYFLDNLTKEFPENSEYWGYLGNSCISLNLPNRALISYRNAEALVKENEVDQWITFNIANLLNNRGLPSEALKSIQKGLLHAPGSLYGHERYVNALKLIKEENKEYDEQLKDGFKGVKNMTKGEIPPEMTSALLLAEKLLGQ